MILLLDFNSVKDVKGGYELSSVYLSKLTLQHSSCLPDLNSLRRGPVFTRETVSEKYRGSPEPLTLLKLKVEPQIRFDSVFFLIIQRCRGLSSPPKDRRHRILQIHLEINSDWLTQLMLRMNSMALNRVIDVLHSILNPSNYVVRGGSSFRYRATKYGEGGDAAELLEVSNQAGR